MKMMNPLIILLLMITSSTTMWFVNALKPSSTGAFVFFAAWLFSPYILIIASLLSLHHKGKSTLHWYAATVVVTAGSILLLADTIYWHPDAQGAIAIIMVPMLQGIVFAFLLPLFRWLLSKT